MIIKSNKGMATVTDMVTDMATDMVILMKIKIMMSQCLSKLEIRF